MASPTWEEMYWKLNDATIKRISTLEAENANLKADIAAYEAQKPDDATYKMLVASYEKRITDLEGQLEKCIVENQRGIQRKDGGWWEMRTDDTLEVNPMALLKECLDWKRKYFALEMNTKEIKLKVNQLAKHLGKDRPKAAKIWESLKEWANENP